MQVKDLDSKQTIFVSDSQEVESIKQNLGIENTSFDSFFVVTGEGEYTEVYGMNGIIPYLGKNVYKLK